MKPMQMTDAEIVEFWMTYKKSPKVQKALSMMSRIATRQIAGYVLSHYYKFRVSESPTQKFYKRRFK